VTARVTVEQAGAGELRVTLTADIRISGDLGPLARLQDAPPEAADGTGQDHAASGQEFLTVEQAAEVLHVSRDKIYALICTRQLVSLGVHRQQSQWTSGLEPPGRRSPTSPAASRGSVRHHRGE
jgi:hypothetical protein